MFKCNITGSEYSFIKKNARDLAKMLKAEYKLSKKDIFSYYKNFKASQSYYNLLSDFIDKLDDLNKTYDLETSDIFSYKIDIMQKYYASPFNKSLDSIIKQIRKDFDEGIYKLVGFKERFSDDYFNNSTKFYCFEKFKSADEAVNYFKKNYQKKIDTFKEEIDYNFLKYQFDFSPVVLNFNETLKKYELIDGFKRLFTIPEEFLDFEIPVKIYNNLSNEDFLLILNNCNGWKPKNLFYDRGYIFSLVNKFKIEPKEFDFSNKKDFFDLELTNVDLVKLLEWYSLNLPFYIKNPHFMEDLNLIKEIINYELPMDNATPLAARIKKKLIKSLGEVRAFMDLDFDYLDVIDKTIKTKENILSKKNATASLGWINNFINKEIVPELEKNLKELRIYISLSKETTI